MFVISFLPIVLNFFFFLCVLSTVFSCLLLFLKVLFVVCCLILPYARHVFIQDREAPFEFRKIHSFFSFFNNKAHTHTHRESTEKTKVCYDKQEQTVLFNKVDRRKGNPKNTKRLLKPQNTLSFFFYTLKKVCWHSFLPF